MNKDNQNSDTNQGVLPFRISIPVTRYALECGRKVVRFTIGIYHLVGFTKGRGHAHLLKIEKECGEVDPDILPDLYINNATEAIEEYKAIATEKSDHLYWNQPNLSIVK